MERLRRIRSTDLDVLRSMLLEETPIHTDDIDDNKIGSGDMGRVATATVAEKRVRLRSSASRPPDKPFLITRIESKHQWGGGALSPLSGESGPKSSVKTVRHSSDMAERPLQSDLLESANRLWDRSLSEARRLFQHSLVTNRLSSRGPSGELVPATVAMQVPPNTDTTRPMWGPGPVESVTETRAARTEHRLAGDEPAIASWLELKERERHRHMEQQMRQSLADSAERHQFHIRHQQRQEAAQLAFELWLASKKREFPVVAKDTASDCESDSGSEAGPAQAGRQPRPSRNSHAVRRSMKCGPRPRSVPSFQLHSNKRMKVAGHQIPLQLCAVVAVPHPQPHSHSHWDWRPPNRSGAASSVNQRMMRPQTAWPQTRTTNLRTRTMPADNIANGDGVQSRVGASRGNRRSMRRKKKSMVIEDAERLPKPTGLDNVGPGTGDGDSPADETGSDLSSVPDRADSIDDVDDISDELRQLVSSPTSSQIHSGTGSQS